LILEKSSKGYAKVGAPKRTFFLVLTESEWAGRLCTYVCVWVHKDLVEQVNAEEEEEPAEGAKRWQRRRLLCPANVKAKQKLQLYNALRLWLLLLHFALAF